MKFRSLLSPVSLLALFVGLSACSAAPGASGDGSGDGADDGDGTGVGGSTGAAMGTGGSQGQFMGTTGSGTAGCISGADEDQDQDGFTVTELDCNDCDPNVNPAALEVIASGDGGGSGEAADEDCDGTVDNVAGPCDGSLAINTSDANDAARAVGLCKFATGPEDWGVVSATWVSVDGTAAPADPDFDLGHGILPAFGANVTVREGTQMLALSSGTARQPTDTATGYASPSGFNKGYTSGHPQGFPKESQACPNTTTGTPHDGTAVEITLRAPSNATGFKFDFDFYTYEWPSYVCSQYNDFFVAIVSPIPAGQTDGNISFDQLGNPVSVNNAFVDVCGCSSGPPCLAGGKSFTCQLGNMELVGTGFEGHAATSWLQTQAPATPMQDITIRWGVYDSGDGVLDSTTLVDNWEWIANGGTVTVGTTVPPT